MKITQSRNKREGWYAGRDWRQHRTRSITESLKDKNTWRYIVLAVEEKMAKEKGLSGCLDHWSAKCRSCEKYYEIPCSVEEFDPDFSYCGSSPSCYP